MTYETLISTAELAAHIDDPDWVILDCRFSLTNVGKGRLDYLEGHIPGAIYAHLDEDLSAPKVPNMSGRHPLPTVAATAQVFSHWGIGPGVQVVAYDDAGGALAAVRAWWMLRWLGHNAVAVLDGGWQIWVDEGYPTRSGEETRPGRVFIPKPRNEIVITTAEVDNLRLDPSYRLFDARTSERFHGQNETIDPVAGHIPGAVSAPYIYNLRPDNRFRSSEELNAHYEKLLGKIPAERAVFYCGSGVTSIHDILAILHAGLGEARLYVGSWSEWITDPKRPIATDS